MRTAICPGSFDPITLGHLNIIRRVSRIFDRVVVLIAVNSGKTQPMFTIEERVDMVRRACERYPNVTVDSSDTLLAEYVKRYENPVLVKGLRAASDFEYEFQIDAVNRHLDSSLRTVYFMASPGHSFLSSSNVKEIGFWGGSITGLVPSINEEIIRERLAKK